MIRKFYEAKINNKDEINFGEQESQKDFVYVGDIARAILFFLNKINFQIQSTYLQEKVFQ